MSSTGWLSNGERGPRAAIVSHTASLMRWKSSSAGGTDLVRWLRFPVFKQYDGLGGGCGPQEQEVLTKRSHACEVDPTDNAVRPGNHLDHLNLETKWMFEPAYRW